MLVISMSSMNQPARSSLPSASKSKAIVIRVPMNGPRSKLVATQLRNDLPGRNQGTLIPQGRVPAAFGDRSGLHVRREGKERMEAPDAPAGSSQRSQGLEAETTGEVESHGGLALRSRRECAGHLLYRRLAHGEEYDVETRKLRELRHDRAELSRGLRSPRPVDDPPACAGERRAEGASERTGSDDPDLLRTGHTGIVPALDEDCRGDLRLVRDVLEVVVV